MRFLKMWNQSLNPVHLIVHHSLVSWLELWKHIHNFHPSVQFSKVKYSPMLHHTTVNHWVIFIEISFKTSELISILLMPLPSSAIYPHSIHELVKWDPMQSQRWTSEMDTVTCLGWHKAKSGTDFHSQCLCYGTSPHGTTRLSLTDLGITG